MAPKNQIDSPIFVSGRQHSGNTVLVDILGGDQSILPMRNEGDFFEYHWEWRALSSKKKKQNVLESIRMSQSPPLKDSTYKELKSRLERKIARKDNPVIIYKTGMHLLCNMKGAKRWVQKATSYIFYIEDILHLFPDAKIIYLLRNPYDLAASTKRRGNRDRLARKMWGWIKGLEIARTYSQKFPSNIEIIRYEDLVRHPTNILKQLCKFTGLEFSEDLLSVGHVNKSETPYNNDKSNIGLTDSRVGYYSDALEPVEIRFVTTLIPTRWLNEFYSSFDFRHDSMPKMRPAFIQLALENFIRLLSGQVKSFKTDPLHTIYRLSKRLLS